MSLINRVQNKSLHNKTSFFPWASPWVRFPTAALQFGGRAKAAQSHSSSLEVVTRHPPPAAAPSREEVRCTACPGFLLLGRSGGAFPCPCIKPSSTGEVCLGVDQGSLTLLPGFVPSRRDIPGLPSRECAQPPTAASRSGCAWAQHCGTAGSLLPVGSKRELAGISGREDGQRLWLTATHPQVERPLVGLGPFGRVGCGSGEGQEKGRGGSSWLAGEPGLFTWQPSARKEVRAIASRLPRPSTGAGMCSGWKCVSAWSQLCTEWCSPSKRDPSFLCETPS